MKKRMKLLVMSAAILMAVPTFAQEARRDNHKEKAKAEMEEMFNELGLDTDQKEKVKAILKEERMAMKKSKVAKEELQELKPEERKVARAKVVLKKDEVRKTTNAKLAEVLTPTQMEKFKVIQEERRELRKENRAERLDNKPMRARPTDAPVSN